MSARSLSRRLRIPLEDVFQTIALASLVGAQNQEGWAYRYLNANYLSGALAETGGGVGDGLLAGVMAPCELESANQQDKNSPRQRAAALSLRNIRGFTVEELSEFWCVTQHQVRARISRAIRYAQQGDFTRMRDVLRGTRGRPRKARL